VLLAKERPERARGFTPVRLGQKCSLLGGAVGGPVGALVGMGIPEYEAKRYEGRVGGTLLSVHCDTAEQITRAKDLLKGTNGTDIASTGEAAGVKTAETRVAQLGKEAGND
jgi:hypothetical protein